MSLLAGGVAPSTPKPLFLFPVAVQPRLDTLPITIIALGGRLDARCSQRQINEWQACSGIALQAHMLPGAGHDFVEARSQEVLRIVRGALAGDAAAAAAAAAAALEGERAEQPVLP